MADGSRAASPEILVALERGAAILRDLLLAHGLVQQPHLSVNDVDELSSELDTRLHQEYPHMDQTIRFHVASMTRADDWPLGRWRAVIEAERQGTLGALEVGLDMVSSTPD